MNEEKIQKYMDDREIDNPFEKSSKEKKSLDDTSNSKNETPFDLSEYYSDIVSASTPSKEPESTKATSEIKDETPVNLSEYYTDVLGKPIPRPQVGGLEATARLFGQGLTYNQMEEIIAALKTGKKVALGEAKLSEFPELYREEERKQSEIMKGIKEESPYLSMVPEFVGAAVSPINKLLFPAATLARLGKAVSPAAKVATEQLVTKAPYLKGTVEVAKDIGKSEIAKEAAKGAVVGGIGGGIAGIGASEYGIEEPEKLAESALEYAKTGTMFGGVLGGGFGAVSSFIKRAEAPVTAETGIAGTAFKKGFQGKGLISKADEARIAEEQRKFATEQASKFTFGEESPISQVQKEMKDYFAEGDYKHWENVAKQKLPGETESQYIQRIEKDVRRKYIKPEIGEVGQPKLENDSEYAERLKDYVIGKNFDVPPRITDIDNTTMSNLIDIVQDLENTKELNPKNPNLIKLEKPIILSSGKEVTELPLTTYLKMVNPEEYNRLVQTAKDQGIALEKSPEFQYLILGNKITNRDKDVLSLAPKNDIREFFRGVNDFYGGKMSPTDEHNFGRWLNGEEIPGIPPLTSTKLTDILAKYPRLGENIKESAKEKLTQITGKSAKELFEKFKDVRAKTAETFLNKALPEHLATRLVRDSERRQIEQDVYKSINDLLEKVAYSSGTGSESRDILREFEKRVNELNSKYKMNIDIKDFINKTHDIAAQNAAYTATHSLQGRSDKTAIDVLSKITNITRYGGLNVFGRALGTPVTVTRAVYNATDNTLIPLAERLQSMPPPLSFMGDALRTGIENKSGKNAALFMILQNPESRKVAKEMLGATEDQSEK